MDSTAEPDTVPAALVRAAERFADREALVDDQVRLTYGELYDQVRRCARFFVTSGIRHGDRVAICSPNTYHWVVAALATLHVGGTLVPVNTRFTGPEMLDVIERSGAAAVVIAGRFLGTDRLDQLREAGMPALRCVLRVPIDDEPAPEVGVTEWADLDWHRDERSLAEVDQRAAAVAADDISDILFTSGTTGRSKGAMSAHSQALGVAEAWADCAQLDASDRYLVINPFFHSFGYKAGMLAALVRAATMIPQTQFDVHTTLRLVSTERITVLPGPPTIYQVMLDTPARAEHDLSSLRLAVTGAATVPVALVERMQSELSFDTVLTAYGLTEAVVATMCRADDDAHTVANSSGRATAGFDVRLAADSGEVLLRGPNVMRGYLDDPDATSATIDADGWLHTGDVGMLDERGYLRITDRIKDMYICGGFNVYPAEVEQTLARMDAVAESAVIGIPDSRLGEAGKAYVVCKPGHELDAETVIDYCKQRLANYKVPRAVELCTQLPRNPSGKVLKRVLRGDTEAV